MPPRRRSGASHALVGSPPVWPAPRRPWRASWASLAGRTQPGPRPPSLVSDRGRDADPVKLVGHDPSHVIRLVGSGHEGIMDRPEEHLGPLGLDPAADAVVDVICLDLLHHPARSLILARLEIQ